MKKSLRTKKIIAWIGLLCSIVLFGLSALGGICLYEWDFYDYSETAYRKMLYEEVANQYSVQALADMLSDENDGKEQLLEYNFRYGILEAETLEGVDLTDESIYEEWNGNFPQIIEDAEQRYVFYITLGNGNVYTYSDSLFHGGKSLGDSAVPAEGETVYCVISILPDDVGLGLNGDMFTQANTIVTAGYALRYSIYLILIAALVMAIFCFGYLVSKAGRVDGKEEIVATGFNKLPLEIYCLLSFAAVNVLFVFLKAVVQDIYYRLPEFLGILSAGIIAFVICVLGICFLLGVAVRVKGGALWKNTLVFRMIVLLKKGIDLCCRNLSLLWQVSIVILVFIIFEFIFQHVFLRYLYLSSPAMNLFRLCERAILIGLIFWAALQADSLRKGGERLAAGDLQYQVDTSFLFWEFKRHGKNLNSIRDGISRAVEERMKSEHFKTELITNVTHDIKTPLTSIINYVDLLEKEELSNENAKEYLEVLKRQSARLKKLIEDLMEASKASTGNLSVKLEELDAGVFLVQTVGEFEEKLRSHDLELRIIKPEHPVSITADGRHLWRVIDNLMNNVCKYAQPQTRVYINIEETGTAVMFIFRNTSRYELNVGSDELMERFVRGDSSRNTEGNGLGLSIADSLMRLMNGSLEIQVDGDLFKAILSFCVKK